MSLSNVLSLVAVVPAAGVGKRMQSDCPKQYLTINGVTVLEHTINRLLTSSHINSVIVVLNPEDDFFSTLSLADNPQVKTVIGGKERVDSVLAGLHYINQFAPSNLEQWVLVHDAARPCVDVNDIDALIATCIKCNQGGLLGFPVRDTMKRTASNNVVKDTVERKQLWHALTPQMYKASELINAIEQGLEKGVDITDESSAIEAAGLPSMLVEGNSNNIKITRPDDLIYASFILNKQQETK